MEVKRIGHHSGAPHKAYPGHTPIAYVSFEELPERPVFQMLRVDLPVQDDAPPGCTHPGTKLNVFDRWTAVPLCVKAAKG
jgi:hypothetical protein